MLAPRPCRWSGVPVRKDGVDLSTLTQDVDSLEAGVPVRKDGVDLSQTVL